MNAGSQNNSLPTLFMAPMLGLTDGVYRSAYCKYFKGFDRAVTPFIKTMTDGTYKECKFKDLLPKNNSLLPIIPQLLSNQADDFVPIAEELYQLGYASINLNLGCPVPTTAGRGKGCGLMPHTELVDQLLNDITGKISARLSIKTRIGMHHAHELEKLIPVFNRYPLEMVIIHPRTGDMKYSGQVDMLAFQNALGQLKHPVVYSGDLQTIADVNKLRQSLPLISGYMIGRGGLRDPFLPGAIKTSFGEVMGSTPSKIPRELFYDMIEGYRTRSWNDRQILIRLKSYCFYLMDGLETPPKLIKQVKKSTSLENLMLILGEVLL